jgi:hypothetical protein
MTITVLDSADQAEAVTTGVIPVPKGIAEDNAAQAAKKEAGKAPVKIESVKTEPVKAADKPAEVAAEPADDDVEGEDGLTPRQKREYTKSMLATIGKKHRKQMEAEELAVTQYNRATLAEQRADAVQAELDRIKTTVAPPKVEEAAKEPEREAFKDDKAYWDAMVDFRVDQKLKASQAESDKRQQENYQAEIIAHAKAQVERAIELVPDFKDVTDAVDTKTPTYIMEAMQASDLFPELWYHMASHEADLARINKMTEGLRWGTPQFTKAAQRQLVELGKIESTLKPFAAKSAEVKPDNASTASQTNGAKPKLETGSVPSKPRVQAPIIQPLNGGSASQVDKDESEMTTDEVIAAWQKKHGARLTARKRH